MRDPRGGRHGRLGGRGGGSARLAWVAALLGAGLWLALVAVPACGRGAMVVVLARGQPAEGASLAAALAHAASPGVAGGALLLTAAGAVAAGTGAAALAGLAPWAGAAAGAASAVAAARSPSPGSAPGGVASAR